VSRAASVEFGVWSLELKTNGVTTPHSPKNEQFEKYLTAIKGAKLSEMQLQKLNEDKANDDRTRTIERINERRAQSEDEQYRKMRGNGYTVGEMRRGVDQVDKALERKEVQNAECRVQGMECEVDENNSKLDALQTPHTLPVDATVNSVGCDVSDINAVAQQYHGTNASMNVADEAGNVSQASRNTNTTQYEDIAERMAINASEQQANPHATSAGTTVGRSTGIAASLAATITGMTPVSPSETARRHGELDMKISSAAGMANAAKVNAKDNVTQEALTAASETQQAANDPRPAQPDPTVMQTTRDASADIAASQTLPNTSLMERIDQARLINRVAGAFRSLANQNGTIRMKLHPEELGALTVRMQIEAGKVTAKLEAETETAKRILLDNIETLKKKLKEQNLEVAAFDIDVVSNETSQPTGKQSKHTIAKNKNHTESGHVDFFS